jgi:pyruvate/2-oxoglutarate dehydrogenase complex dihydrolipoamide dehydrogenase (E3) component
LLAEQTRLAAGRFAVSGLVDAGIDVLLGSLVFQGPDSLRVGGQSLSFQRSIVCLPPHGVLPAIPGLAGVQPCLVDRLASLEHIPRRWAILGGSTLACELAQTLVALGSEVELITAAPRLLADEASPDRDQAALHHAVDGHPTASERLERRLAQDGVQLWLGWQAIEASRAGAAKGLLIERRVEQQAVERQKVLADEILVVGERGSDLEWLRPEAAGVTIGPRGLVADERLRTSNPRILAVRPEEYPDPLDVEYLAALARLAVDNAFGGGERSVADLVTPRRLRLDPPVTCVGSRAVWNVSRSAMRDYYLPITETLLGGLDGGATVSSNSFVEGSWIILRVDPLGDRLIEATLVCAAAQQLADPLTRAVDAAVSGWSEAAIGRWGRRIMVGSLPPGQPKTGSAPSTQPWWRRLFGSR